MTAFAQKESDNDALLDLADAANEVKNVFDGQEAGLASLNANFIYKAVLTPLRLDVEIDKVELVDFYAYILEVWESVNAVTAGPIEQVATPSSTSLVMLYSGYPGMQQLIASASRHSWRTLNRLSSKGRYRDFLVIDNSE
ncbi:hypothetical protein CYMTET_29787 [Cymbomonas tetramitiformis]|uniref:Uncharacterized protein n=1 Tax=Cymbomonas tetramitiformis TaxID=36881 RepID=A0AAE0KUL1_9CHLO|nr:hypothetical protein CYMTET_29787 [Cymbomonas tetramitiformis]